MLSGYQFNLDPLPKPVSINVLRYALEKRFPVDLLKVTHCFDKSQFKTGKLGTLQSNETFYSSNKVFNPKFELNMRLFVQANQNVCLVFLLFCYICIVCFIQWTASEIQPNTVGLLVNCEDHLLNFKAVKVSEQCSKTAKWQVILPKGKQMLLENTFHVSSEQLKVSVQIFKTIYDMFLLF